MTRVVFDGNVYDKLVDDPTTRHILASLTASGQLEVLATPVVVEELRDSPFRGVPSWFPVTVEPEAVLVLGHARLGMARLSEGRVYTRHRGRSNKVRDAIIAESASALADVFVSEDRRCRKRLGELSSRCRPMTYAEFRAWLAREKTSEE
jgi:hypothetical protein